MIGACRTGPRNVRVIPSRSGIGCCRTSTAAHGAHASGLPDLAAKEGSHGRIRRGDSNALGHEGRETRAKSCGSRAAVLASAGIAGRSSRLKPGAMSACAARRTRSVAAKPVGSLMPGRPRAESGVLPDRPVGPRSPHRRHTDGRMRRTHTVCAKAPPGDDMNTG